MFLQAVANSTNCDAVMSLSLCAFVCVCVCVCVCVGDVTSLLRVTYLVHQNDVIHVE